MGSQMNPEKRAILPNLAFRGFASRYQRPAASEGFQDVTEVAFAVRHMFSDLIGARTSFFHFRVHVLTPSVLIVQRQ